MTLAEAERQGVAAQNEGIDRKEQAIQGVIDSAFKIVTDLGKAISNDAANKAYSKMQEEYAQYSASGEALKNADGSPADMDQVKANYNSWVESKLDEVNPLIRGKVRDSWNSNRASHMGNLATRSISLLNEQRQQSANESYARALTSSYEGADVAEQASLITQGGDYDLDGMLSFLDGNTWQEKLGNAGLYNDSGLKMIQYGKELTDLGYSPYDVSNSLKNSRQTFVMSSVEQTVRGSYMDMLKTTGDEASFWKETHDFISGDIPGMGRKLTSDEATAYAKRLKELVSIDKAALVEQNNKAYGSFTSAAIAYTGQGGIMDSEWIGNALEENGVYKSLLSDDAKQALIDIGKKNDAVIEYSSLVERLNGVSSISEQSRIIKDFTKGLTYDDMAAFSSLDLYTVENNKARVRTVEEYYNANASTGGFSKAKLSNDAGEISKGIAQEASDKVDGIVNAARDAYVDGNAWSVGRYDSEVAKELAKNGFDMEDPAIAEKISRGRLQVKQWSDSAGKEASGNQNESISDIYDILTLDIANGKVAGRYQDEFLSRMDAKGIDVDSDEAKAAYSKMYQTLQGKQATREENEEIAAFSKDFSTFSEFRYASQNPDARAIHEGGLTVSTRHEIFKKYGKDISKELGQGGSSEEILKSIAEEYGVDPSSLDLGSLGIYDGVNAISAEYASNTMDRGIEAANYYFDMYGKREMVGASSKTFNEAHKEYEAIYNSRIPTTDGFRKAPTDPYERQEYSKLVQGLKEQLVFGDLNGKDARTALLEMQGMLTEDDYKSLLSLADEDFSGYLKKDFGIDANECLRNSLEKLQVNGKYNYSSDPYVNGYVKGKFAEYITDSATRKALENKQLYPADIQKKMDGWVAEATLSPMVNAGDAKSIRGMYSADGDNKDFTSALSGRIQESKDNLQNGRYDTANPIANQNANAFLSSDGNAEAMRLLGSEVARKTDGIGKVSVEDQSLLALSAGLQANGFTLEYDPFDPDKEKVAMQKENIISLMGNLDDITFTRTIDTASMILDKVERAKSLEAETGLKASIDSNGDLWAGDNKISYVKQGNATKAIAETRDGSYVDLSTTSKGSIERKVADITLGAYQSWETEQKKAIMSNPKANKGQKIKLVQGYPNNGWTAELAREAVAGNEEIQRDLDKLRKLYPQASIEIEFGNAYSPKVVIKEIK